MRECDDSKGQMCTEKGGCGARTRHNQYLWKELIPLYHLAQWKEVLLPWQEESSSRMNTKRPSTAPTGAPQPLVSRSLDGEVPPILTPCSMDGITNSVDPWENEFACSCCRDHHTSLIHSPRLATTVAGRPPITDCSFVTLHYLIDNLSCHSRQRRVPVHTTVCSLSHSQFPNPIHQLYSYFMNHTLGPN